MKTGKKNYKKGIIAASERNIDRKRIDLNKTQVRKKGLKFFE